ncbi:MAG: glutathione S-transferase family protein [Burkholderiaceae bacterium]
MELHGCKGCGSVVVEALLDLAGASYTRSVFDWDDRAAWDRLRAINPLAQVPTLVLDDGTVLTESAGIALWIADRYPEAKLLPEAASARALGYRWIVSFATNIYGPIIVGDFPERWVDGEAAHASLKEHALQRLKDAWLAFEERIEPSPYLLGTNISALDVYVAMISRWRPGRAWLAEHCPKAIGAVKEAERHPVIASVWARNF